MLEKRRLFFDFLRRFKILNKFKFDIENRDEVRYKIRNEDEQYYVRWLKSLKL